MARSPFDGLQPTTLDAIHEAALTITSELSLPIVLNRIVALARDLADARYAALGIPDSKDDHLVQFITSGMDEHQKIAVGDLPVGKGLLGALLEADAKPIRVANLADDPRSVGFVPGHPRMTSFLGVPIRSRGKLLGNLYLTDKLNAPEFDETDQKIIETLAGYAAVAIENARLYQQNQRLAILEERERIGIDLHDGIIQSIYAVGLTLEHARYLLDDAEIPASRERLGEAIDGLNMIIKDIRNYIMDLRPERFQGTDLSTALARLTREVDLEYDARLNGQLDERTAVTAFHIVQEALANAAKHAAATQLDVDVRYEDRKIMLKIRDNGRGFTQDDTDRRLGHGLSNMALRARSIGGDLSVVSSLGEGTEVVAQLPFEEPVTST
jgi:signal transduction histidine kinase